MVIEVGACFLLTSLFTILTNLKTSGSIDTSFEDTKHEGVGVTTMYVVINLVTGRAHAETEEGVRQHLEGIEALHLHPDEARLLPQVERTIAFANNLVQPFCYARGLGLGGSELLGDIMRWSIHPRPN